MSTRDEIVSVDNCNYVRLASKISRLEEKADKINKLNLEMESFMKEANKMLDLVSLARQMYDLVSFEETYAETLEAAIEHERDNIPMMSSLQKSIDIREMRSQTAVKLSTELMRNRME